MKKIMALAGLSLVLGMGQAKAETIDLSTIKCGDFLKMSKDDIGSIMLWLAGYEAGKSETPTFDTAAFEKVAGVVGETCAKNADLGLVTAMKQASEAE